MSIHPANVGLHGPQIRRSLRLIESIFTERTNSMDDSFAVSAPAAQSLLRATPPHVNQTTPPTTQGGSGNTQSSLFVKIFKGQQIRPPVLSGPTSFFLNHNTLHNLNLGLFHSSDPQSSDLQICVTLTSVTMHYTQTLLLLLLTHLLAFTSAGLNDIGGMFPPRDLIGDIGAKAIESILPRADTQIVASCIIDYSLDSTIVLAPDMIRTVSVQITGLPEADDHVDAFKKEVEDACFADNLKEYIGENLGKDEFAVTMIIKTVIDSTSEGAAPRDCQEDAIKKFTGLTAFSGCDQPGL